MTCSLIPTSERAVHCDDPKILGVALQPETALVENMSTVHSAGWSRGDANVGLLVLVCCCYWGVGTVVGVGIGVYL